MEDRICERTLTIGFLTVRKQRSAWVCQSYNLRKLSRLLNRRKYRLYNDTVCDFY
jgi:hypothetical protein